MQAERERRDDAEVAATAADRPEEVGVLVGARADALAVREDHLRLEQVVDREPELPGQVAKSAAEREAADAGGGDDAARRREAVLAGGLVDLGPRAAAADADGAGRGIDLDVLHRRQVDHDAIVDGPQPSAVVAAAPDGQRQVVAAGEGDDLGDVAGTGTARDQRRAPVDHRVVDLARLVVVGVVGADQPALVSRELAPRGLRGCAYGGHLAVLLGRRASARDAIGRTPSCHDPD
jgi:hypothetical protein